MVADLKAARLHLDFLNRHVRGQCDAYCHPTAGTVTNLYEVLRQADIREAAADLAKFTAEAVATLRAYRGRIHRAVEDDDGSLSDWHTVYGVHRELMEAADLIYIRALQLGLLEQAPREYGL